MWAPVRTAPRRSAPAKFPPLQIGATELGANQNGVFCIKVTKAHPVEYSTAERATRKISSGDGGRIELGKINFVKRLKITYPLEHILPG
jgi:hypothetical protein